jgi:hypothetical protein
MWASLQKLQCIFMRSPVDMLACRRALPSRTDTLTTREYLRPAINQFNSARRCAQLPTVALATTSHHLRLTFRHISWHRARSSLSRFSYVSGGSFLRSPRTTPELTDQLQHAIRSPSAAERSHSTRSRPVRPADWHRDLRRRAAANARRRSNPDALRDALVP